jgi:hypothetical protein
MGLDYQPMKLTCVGLGVAGTGVPEVIAVNCPVVLRQAIHQLQYASSQIPGQNTRR